MIRKLESVRRSSWLVAALVVLAGAAIRPAAGDEKPGTFRVVAYNVYECTGWPKDRTQGHVATAKGQMPARFAQELELHEPDLINFSESPREEVVADIARRLKMNYVFLPSGGKWPGAILTRYQIVASRKATELAPTADKALFTRHWGMAELHRPDGKRIIVHSAHLHPSDAALRQREVAVMLEVMKPDLAAEREMILMGDLNHEPTRPEYRQWIQGGWTDGFQATDERPGVTFMADDLKRRIDYVFAVGPLAKSVIESRPLFEGEFRLNTSDPADFALSDHLPQLCVFRLDP
ncbi:endonuclease/exonuclease/phosphatase family protein [Planctomyces sp. SH-PL14]|uniref:endonuclease/exonuclease/phosphatase family protein n=1 Tax=Planctomyces sp. SH-PL14 TaxID=1632864 RepID=UPI00078CAB52|nr:endonuclease/exonuclease/phosphatase family protein [Planctomyces sp. SH-PL14]AMV16343.1 Endonuclease/Exonuclease/phosphatase family protein [Planctomyces sp. SH-PL14]